MNDERLSKRLSYILRHNPESIGVKLETGGWAETDKVIAGIPGMNIDILQRIVSTDDKMRYSFSQDKGKIRANQGHSCNVDMRFKEAYPPCELYHGTAKELISSIMTEGLIHGSRQYVHLSSDVITAENVGKRHGEPVVLWVDAVRMVNDGYKFYLSDNGVWLTEGVPVGYIRF